MKDEEGIFAILGCAKEEFFLFSRSLFLCSRFRFCAVGVLVVYRTRASFACSAGPGQSELPFGFER